MSTVLTKEALRNLKGQDVKTKDEPVPEWGENAVIRLCVMGGADSESFEKMVQDNRMPDSGDSESSAGIYTEGIRWALLSRTMVDGENNRIFDNDEGAKEIVGELNHRTIQRLVDAAIELNGLGENAVEEAEKNSSDTPPAASGTGSRGNGGGASKKRSGK